MNKRPEKFETEVAERLSDRSSSIRVTSITLSTEGSAFASVPGQDTFGTFLTGAAVLLPFLVADTGSPTPCNRTPFLLAC